MILACLPQFISAEYSDELLTYLKKDFKESSNYNSGIEGVDKIYVINLDHKVERRNHMDTLLINHGFQYERFSAVNGWALDKSQLRKFHLNCLPPVKERRYISPGQIGCLLSHLSIIKQALDKGYETIWILEDDVIFNKHPKEILETFISNMQVEQIEWDVLYTDLNLRAVNPNGSIKHYVVFEGCLGRDFDYVSAGSIDWTKPISCAKQMHHRLGTYSMLLSKRGMLKIFNYFMQHPMQSAYDVDLNFFENTRFFQLFEDVATTNGFESSTTP